MRLGGFIRRATQQLTATARQFLAAGGERAIWRHQLVGRRRATTDNPMGEDPEAPFWETEDHVVEIRREGMDEQGRHVIYCRVVPTIGDLFLMKPPPWDGRVASAPTTEVYRVVDVDVRRAPDGRVIYTKVYAVPDRTGKWGAR